MTEKSQNVRRTVLDLLVRFETVGSYSNISLDTAIKRNDFSPSDRALLTLLFYGVLEKKITLDFIIDSLSSLPPSKIEKETRNILRMGIYQLAFADRIPPHAAVNETVSLAAKRSKGFTNAILRSYVRKKDELSFPDKDTDLIRYLSVRYSVCVPLCEKLCASYGPSECESILEAFSHTPPVTLRTNTLKTDTDTLLSEIKERFPEASRTANAKDGITVPSCSVSELDWLGTGKCTVQDEASQISCEVLSAKEGDTVVDVCACPGSKSFGAVMTMKNNGSVLAFDIHENKLSLVEEGAKRLGITVISTKAHDARVPIPSLFEKADKIICDVPCSGFGVISKKPELRYKDPKACEDLPDIQLAILENVSQYLKVGGTLVYSTCTILPEENEDNIARFLEKHTELECVPFKVRNIDAPKGYITLLPHKDKTDGFFIAKLTRRCADRQ